MTCLSSMKCVICAVNIPVVAFYLLDKLSSDD